MAVEHNSTYEMVQVTELLDRCNMVETNKVIEPSLKRKYHHANATNNEATTESNFRKTADRFKPRSGPNSKQKG